MSVGDELLARIMSDRPTEDDLARDEDGAIHGIDWANHPVRIPHIERFPTGSTQPCTCVLDSDHNAGDLELFFDEDDQDGCND